MEQKGVELLKAIRRDPFTASMIRTYDRAAMNTAGKLVLDYGCGYGWGSMLLAATAEKVMAYDPDAERIYAALEAFASANISFTCNKADLDIQPDMICVVQVLQHLNNPQGQLEWLAAKLQSGGQLWASTKLSFPQVVSAMDEVAHNKEMATLNQNIYELSKDDYIYEIQLVKR